VPVPVPGSFFPYAYTYTYTYTYTYMYRYTVDHADGHGSWHAASSGREVGGVYVYA
jgi:hypothetical protein